VLAVPVVDVVVVLAVTNPTPVLVPLAVPVVTPPPTTLPSPLTVPAVMIPPMVPEHAAPLGQQATLPAWSALQMAAVAQQRLEAPRLPQLPKLLGQPVPVRLRRSCGSDSEEMVLFGMEAGM
jgi:hypothetical protein